MAYNTGRALGQLLPPISAILCQFCFNDIFLPGVGLVSVVSWQKGSGEWERLLGLHVYCYSYAMASYDVIFPAILYTKGDKMLEVLLAGYSCPKISIRLGVREQD